MFSRRNKLSLPKLFMALALLSIPVLAWANVVPLPISLATDVTTIEGGNATTANFTFDELAPVGGQVVTIGNTHPGVVSVPSSITVPEGGGGGNFPVYTSTVTTNTNVTISVMCNGGIKQKTITVTP